MATLGGSARGSRNRPPAAATNERFTSGRPKAAAVEATMRSHESAISQPPASAGPSTAAMIGLVRSRCAMPAKPPRLVCSAPAWPRRDRLEVGPGREDGSVAGEDADPRVVVLLELVDRRLHPVGDVAVDRVAGLGPTDGDEGDVVLELVVDCHGGRR